MSYNCLHNLKNACIPIKKFGSLLIKKDERHVVCKIGHISGYTYIDAISKYEPIRTKFGAEGFQYKK